MHLSATGRHAIDATLPGCRPVGTEDLAARSERMNLKLPWQQGAGKDAMYEGHERLRLTTQWPGVERITDDCPA